jgi:hypothetical protein
MFANYVTLKLAPGVQVTVYFPVDEGWGFKMYLINNPSFIWKFASFRSLLIT